MKKVFFSSSRGAERRSDLRPACRRGRDCFAPSGLAMTVLLIAISYCFLTLRPVLLLDASEVFEETHTGVVVREHPKTGRPYVSLVSTEGPPVQDPFARQRKMMKRPDYRMLDPKVKSGEIPYEGPYTSAKKVYIFAASLATLGVAGGAIGMAVAPAAAGGAATGGGTYLAGGAAVAGTATAAGTIKAQPDPNHDDFTQISKSKSLELEEKQEKGDRQEVLPVPFFSEKEEKVEGVTELKE